MILRNVLILPIFIAWADESPPPLSEEFATTAYTIADLPWRHVPPISMDQYDLADYDARFYLRTPKYQRHSEATQAASGVKDGLVGGFTGMYTIVRHPRRTARELEFAAEHPNITAKAVEKHYADNTRNLGLAHTVGELGYLASIFMLPTSAPAIAVNAMKAASNVVETAGISGKVAEVSSKVSLAAGEALQASGDIGKLGINAAGSAGNYGSAMHELAETVT